MMTDPFPDPDPFPDGEGFMDHAWMSLSDLQRLALHAAAHGRTAGRVSTRGVLRRKRLLDEQSRITERGRALLEWAAERS